MKNISTNANIEELISASENAKLIKNIAVEGDVRAVTMSDGRVFRVTYNADKAHGGVQLLNRTSDFVAELLEKVFKDYSALYVYHASGEDKVIENPPTGSGAVGEPRIISTKNTGGSVEYQVECFVRVHDDFEGTPVMEYVRDSFLVTYDDNDIPVYAHRALSGREVTDEKELKSADENLKKQENDYRKLIEKLKKTLGSDENNEQKQKIFKVLIPENAVDGEEYRVYGHLQRRRAQAEKNIREKYPPEEAERRIAEGLARPVQLALFTLNVYVNQLDKKLYTWTLTDGGYVREIELEIDADEKFEWRNVMLRDTANGVQIAKRDANGKYGKDTYPLGEGRFVLARTGKNGYTLSVAYSGAVPKECKNNAIKLCSEYSSGLKYAIAGCTKNAVVGYNGERGTVLADDTALNDIARTKELWLERLLTKGFVLKHNGRNVFESGACYATTSVTRACPVCGTVFYAEDAPFEGYKYDKKLANGDFCCENCMGTYDPNTGKGVISGAHGYYTDDVKLLTETAVCMMEGCNNIFHRSEGSRCKICGKTVCGRSGHTINGGICPECANAGSLADRANEKLYKMLRRRCSAIKRNFRFKITDAGKPSARVQAFEAGANCVYTFYPVTDKNGGVRDYAFISKDNV